MMQSDIDHTLFEGGNAGDDKLFVKFENKPVQDKTATAEKGRPIYKEVAHISIRAAGSQNFVCRRASLADMRRFPRHFAAFEQKREMPVEGTLLSEWPLISRTMAKELEGVHVKTVEQLVNMSDQNSQNFMGINELKRKANLFLDHAAGEAPMLKMQDELDQRDQTIAQQQTTINLMMERLTALEKNTSGQSKLGVDDEITPAYVATDLGLTAQLAEKMDEPAAEVQPSPKPRSRRKQAQG